MSSSSTYISVRIWPPGPRRNVASLLLHFHSDLKHVNNAYFEFLSIREKNLIGLGASIHFFSGFVSAWRDPQNLPNDLQQLNIYLNKLFCNYTFWPWFSSMLGVIHSFIWIRPIITDFHMHHEQPALSNRLVFWTYHTYLTRRVVFV